MTAIQHKNLHKTTASIRSRSTMYTIPPMVFVEDARCPAWRVRCASRVSGTHNPCGAAWGRKALSDNLIRRFVTPAARQHRSAVPAVAGQCDQAGWALTLRFRLRPRQIRGTRTPVRGRGPRFRPAARVHVVGRVHELVAVRGPARSSPGAGVPVSAPQPTAPRACGASSGAGWSALRRGRRRCGASTVPIDPRRRGHRPCPRRSRPTQWDPSRPQGPPLVSPCLCARTGDAQRCRDAV